MNLSILEEAPWFGPAFGLLFGLIVGSFINVLIHRLPLRRSIVSPRSACPKCGGLIRAYDNIPVFSYLLLRGRCRNCGTSISIRYPFVEAVVGAASLVAFLRHGFGLEYASEFTFATAMVALVFIDFDHQILPDAITLPGTVLGVILAAPRASITLTESVAGAALGAGLLFLVAEVYLRLRNIEGMGMGDVKMMAMIGAFLGWKGVFVTLFLGSLLGTLVGLIVMAVRGQGLQTKLPFGTFLGIAAVATLFAGPPIISWYSGFF